ncbi:MAG: 3',5'-cyclic-AMP phosphodiesterase [Steroidobacteraceae bacterium]
MTAAIRLVQITDTHLLDAPDGDVRGVATLPALRAVLARAAADIAAADAVLVTGDVVHDEPRAYEHFRREFRSLGKPVLCIPGNHDDPAAMRTALAAPPFQVGGHVDFGAWRIVLLDSVIPGAAGGRLAAAELERLERALAGAGPRHVLVCLHHHPVAMSSAWLDEIGLENAAEFFAIVERSPRARAIAWGHVHQALEQQRGGLRLLATPSTCTQFLPQAPTFAVDTRPPGYRMLQLAADGGIASEVVWLDRFAAPAGWPEASASSCSAA